MSLFPFDFLKAHTDISTPVALLGFREDPAMLGSSLRNVSLPVSLWNCVERSRCFADLTYYVAQVGVGFPRLGIILVPFLERSLDHIPNKDMAMFEKYHSNVHWIFSVRKHEDVLEHFSGHLCQVVTVTEAEINAPWNSYNSCEVRKLYTAADDPRIVDRMPSPGTYPKHGRVTFAAHDDKSVGCFKPHGPVGERLVEVYLGLNNTLVETCNYGETDSLLLEKRADFIITATNFAPSTSYYQHAVYPPMSVCFLTRRGQPVRPSFASTWLSFFSVSLMLVPLAAVLFLCLRMRVHRSQGRHNALDWASFFMATYVNQSPLLPTSSPSVAVRFTIAAWMFGMFFLIQFTQTEITASKSVQAFSFEIRHTADLTSRLDAGIIRPCMLHTLINLFDKYTDESSHLKSIHDANKKCVSGCLSTLFSDCILQAQRGTHAFIHYCRPFLIEGNMPSGLVMGHDRLVTNLLWEPLHRKNPLR
ncbi:hypothetical protein MTO96_034161 [Rhipicephalus appendiculatus]